MKKTLLGILIGLVILAVGVTSAVAAGPGGRHHGTGTTGTGVCRYVDANGDGICDNCRAAHTGRSCTDANGDGICDNCGIRHTGCGSCYVDANGDGICDNCGAGQGGGYVDADGDGVCDNYTGSQGGHHGGGHGGGCRR